MLNINDRINRELIPFSIDLMKIESDIAKKLLKEYKKTEKQLVEELRLSAINEVKRTRYQEARLTKLLGQTRATIKSYYKKSYDIFEDEMVSLVDLSAKTVGGSINTTVGANISTTAISPANAIKIFDETVINGLYINEWFDQSLDKSVNLYKQTIRDGMIRGESMAQLVKRVRGTRAEQFKDGISKQEKTRIEAMTRTIVQNISNASRAELYKNNEDILDGVTWLATLDSRTTIICIALDGLSWDNNRKPIGHNKNYPGNIAHMGCRSTQLPILKRFNKLPKKIQKKIPVGERASMNGGVAGSTTYEDYLKTQDETFQKKQLGATKYRLWTEKKIKFTDLISQKNNPVSVKQLLEKFDKAT